MAKTSTIIKSLKLNFQEYLFSISTPNPQSSSPIKLTSTLEYK
jgi:hypothetical protein